MSFTRIMSLAFGLAVFCFFTGVFNAGIFSVSKLFGYSCWGSSCEDMGVPLCAGEATWCAVYADFTLTVVATDTPIQTVTPVVTPTIPNPVPTDTNVPTPVPTPTCVPKNTAAIAAIEQTKGEELSKISDDESSCEDKAMFVCAGTCIIRFVVMLGGGPEVDPSCYDACTQAGNSACALTAMGLTAGANLKYSNQIKNLPGC